LYAIINIFRLRFKSLLPSGHAKDEIITTQVVDRGLLVKGPTGGESWNPFDGWPGLQFVPFVEVGRVAPDWNIEDLHEDMKWSAGLGGRFWANCLVARIDSAASDEGFEVQLMVAQPFQF
jgi:hypothetical protein